MRLLNYARCCLGFFSIAPKTSSSLSRVFSLYVHLSHSVLLIFLLLRRSQQKIYHVMMIAARCSHTRSNDPKYGVRLTQGGQRLVGWDSP